MSRFLLYTANCFILRKTWVDILVSLLFALFYPVPIFPLVIKNQKQEHDKIEVASQVTSPHPQEAHRERAVILRNTLLKIAEPALKKKNGVFNAWASLLGSDTSMVQCTVTIPRCPKLLREWGLLDKDEDLKMVEECLPKDPSVKLHLFFPDSILASNINIPEEKNDNGCLTIKDNEVSINTFPKDIPIILFIHGGGRTFPLFFSFTVGE
jgi:hypothetical protein